MNRVVIDDVSVLAQTLAAEFTTHAADSIARRGKFIVGLPGGSIATTFLPVLASLSVDWRRIDLFWIDERAVPPDHPDSNYGIASRLLLAPARVPGPSVHRMYGELPELEQAARRASDELKSIAGDPPRMDLALVGVGPDGHVASIFPGAVSSASASSPVIAVHDAPKPPSRRLTMNLSVLAGAGIVVVAAFGASKRATMRDALEESDKTSPVAQLLRRASSSLVLLDREAGLS